MHENIIVVSRKSHFINLIQESLSGLTCALRAYKTFDRNLINAEQDTSGSRTLIILDEAAFEARLKLGRQKTSLPFILVLDHPEDELIEKALSEGALDVLHAPLSQVLISHKIQSLFSRLALSREISRNDIKPDKALGLSQLSEQCRGLNRSIQLAQRAARSAIPVLIEGETGVGKTTLAKAISQNSDRRNKPFISIDCAANTDNISTVLFGKEGRLQATGNGTLLIEEIGYLSIDLQLRLLDILNQGKFSTTKHGQTVKFSGRLIATTSQNLIEQVQRGLFSADLYYRISVFPIALPSLRDRSGDIISLAKAFIRKYANCGGRFIEGIDANAMKLLEGHSWPGNVRELENLIYRASMMAQSWQLTQNDFPGLCERPDHESVRQTETIKPRAVPEAHLRRLDDDLPKIDSYRIDADHPAQSIYGKLDLFDERGCLKRIDAIEDEIIRFAIIHVGGNMSHVARDLGIGRTTLYRKTKGLDEELKMSTMAKTA